LKFQGFIVDLFLGLHGRADLLMKGIIRPRGFAEFDFRFDFVGSIEVIVVVSGVAEAVLSVTVFVVMAGEGFHAHD
jgi:hypothetical protein